MRKNGSPAQEATVFLNARLVDPASGKDEPGGLLVKDGVIADLGGHLRRNAPERAKVVDCGGHVLCPASSTCRSSRESRAWSTARP
jgi:imidazolonepropionase-like amidohydrolase